ncbi:MULTISPECIES: DUF2235 domain-containing protein [Stenotrophomonas]|uniref:T6SS phospholipase effector Tle1-like catalytic domain-containing protein n=1 Tax=Stenotrophomonas TaxID=40323 RepID=UPI001E5C7F96|nr:MULTISPECIES: DUF2235 domain-containing protein [Stenotrophomonas]
MSDPEQDCYVDLKWGFFFDGTNNNLGRDRPHLAQSNIARLYDVFDLGRAGSENIKQYIAGVGTPFEEEVGDQGKGVHQAAGLSAGWGGEARINWALLKVLDNLHQYYEGVGLGRMLGVLDPQAVKGMSADMNIPIHQLRKLTGDEVELLREIGMPKSVRLITSTAATSPNDPARRATLKARREVLASKLSAWRRTRKPRVRVIRISVFGFSRGAAEARVFSSWLKDALDPDFTLCGIPVQVDFLGIFDTVASVGLANSSIAFDGHGGWGREQDMEVPDYVKECVHMVAALEVRASFPLDAYRGLAKRATQLVYPGVHSDLGGGYIPSEQGKGYVGAEGRDAAKFSQIPLQEMYQRARAAGVPLNKDNGMLAESAREAMEVDQALISAYSDYFEATGGVSYGSLQQIMHDHYGRYLQWRKLRLGDDAPAGLKHQPFVSRAGKKSGQDVVDLVMANYELKWEYEALLKDERSDPALRIPNGLSDNISKFIGLRARNIFPLASLRDAAVSYVWGYKMKCWQEIKPIWEDTSDVDPRISRLMDDYIHDSRAWFKPFGAPNEAAWKRQQEERMKLLEAQDARYKEWERIKQEDERILREGNALERMAAAHRRSAMNSTPQAWPKRLEGADRKDLDAWKSNRQLPYEIEGRESWSIFGYLRWRMVYEDEASWLQQVGDFAGAQARAVKRGIKDKVDDAVDRAAEAAGRAIGNGAKKGADYLLDKAKDALSNGVPRTRL